MGDGCDALPVSTGVVPCRIAPTPLCRLLLVGTWEQWIQVGHAGTQFKDFQWHSPS
jgi:hypothetical protein